ncbi:MAG: hypothetical protein Kow0081_0910 [Candidatus Dojkabacteria bacterium]
MKINDLPPSVAVIIVTWNNENDIRECLNSIEKTIYSNLKAVIVVDNNSSDRTTEIIQKDFPNIELIQTGKNLYFTGGNNFGFNFAINKYAPEFVVTLNPDTIVEPEWIDKLIAIATKDPKIGIVAPKIKFWNNQNEGKINSAGMIFDGFLQGYDRGFEEEDHGQYNFTEEVIAVSGTCMLLRVKMLEQVGMFWEKLRMYLEDLELCIRARKKGWKIFYTSGTTIHHKWMQSTNQSSIVRRKGWMKRNWFLIALRHYSLKSKLAMLKHYFFSK